MSIPSKNQHRSSLTVAWRDACPSPFWPHFFAWLSVYYLTISVILYLVLTDVFICRTATQGQMYQVSESDEGFECKKLESLQVDAWSISPR